MNLDTVVDAYIECALRNARGRLAQQPHDLNQHYWGSK